MQQVDFERLFQKLPSPHMVLDRAYNFVAVNPAYERAVMRSRAELVGRHLFEMFPNDGEGGNRLRASFARVFETGESDTLAYIRYEIPSEDGSFEERYWTAVHTPLPDSEGRVRYLMQNTVDVTDMVRMREAISVPIRSNFGELQLIERAREAESANRTIQAEAADFRRLFKSAPQMIAVLSGPDHLFTFVNDACRKFIAHGDVVGSTVREAVPEVEAQGFIAILDDVYQNGRGHSGESAPVTFHDAEGGTVREAFMDYSYLPIRDAEGRVSGVLFQGTDRTEAVRHMEHLRRLLDEVNHRVKNTLASVQSIASQTLRSARDLPSARRDFEARIIALSKTHNLLSARNWSSLDLGTILREGVAPYTEKGARIDGPAVALDSKAAIAVAMLVHELAANASQYGALSVEEGRLDVSWRPAGDADDPRLLLEWRESGGPVVEKPARRGFGTRVLQRVAEGELGGSVVADYAPEGFFCRMDIPAGNLAKVNHESNHA